jgi:hypothetical protein
MFGAFAAEMKLIGGIGCSMLNPNQKTRFAGDFYSAKRTGRF